MAVTIYEAKTNLSKLIAEVERTGKEIVIRRNNVPVAKLVPFREVQAPRGLGAWAGQVHISEDFDELPEEVAAAFRGERP